MEDIADIMKQAHDAEDDGERVKWYRMAAERGHAPAQNELGDAYYRGLWGIEKDYKEALIWYRKSTEQGNYWAQMNMGEAYKESQL